MKATFATASSVSLSLAALSLWSSRRWMAAKRLRTLSYRKRSESNQTSCIGPAADAVADRLPTHCLKTNETRRRRMQRGNTFCMIPTTIYLDLRWLGCIEAALEELDLLQQQTTLKCISAKQLNEMKAPKEQSTNLSISTLLQQRVLHILLWLLH